MDTLASAELTVIGVGSSDPAAAGFLAAVRDRLAEQGTIAVTIRGSGALLEGPAEEIFALCAELHRIPLELGMPQVCTMLKVEQRATHDAPALGDLCGTAAARNGNGHEPPVRRNGTADPAHAGGGRGDSVAYAVAAGLVESLEETAVQPNLRTLAPARPAPAGVPRTADIPRVAPAADPGPPAVRTAGLTKSYGEGDALVEVLRGVDIEIARGEFVAVMGPSGSGKSTLMHILGALETPSAGTVEIGGTGYAGLDDDAQTQLRRDRIGFVFQFFNLIKTLSAEENVMLPSLIAGEQAERLRPRAHELLELVGLGARVEHLPSEMSGGEQQRVSIARALMREPQLLLADEPTGNLDSRNSAAVLDLLADLQTQSRQTILMVTHDPVAASRATRIIFLRDGLLAGEIPGGDPRRIVEFFSGLSARD